ncbi:hypothetical protein EMCRGX_G022684 [Ephydatia muelleri]
MELKKLKAPRTYLLAHLLRANGTCPADETADLLLAFALTRSDKRVEPPPLQCLHKVCCDFTKGVKVNKAGDKVAGVNATEYACSVSGPPGLYRRQT